ncbi:MAG TPA: hypothetical protein VKR26_20250, partial [Terriglobales bacterium]|nr:hypothetical protein [Terriglobales bacterium]
DHLLIEGRYRQFSGDNLAAIEIYQTLRDFFPDQIDYAFYLANAQWKADHNKDALQTIARMRNLPEPERRLPSRCALAAAAAPIFSVSFARKARAALQDASSNP